MIATLIALTPYSATPGHALAWGVALAGVLQFAMLMAACGRAGLAPRLPWPRLTPRARTLLKRMVPGAIGAGGVQVNLVVDVIIASFLPTGAISFLYYADRLNQLPLGVVGVAVSTALLPLLSRDLARGDQAAANDKLNRAVEVTWLLTIPAAAALAVLATPIIAVLFERGAFDAAATAKTAAALAAYAAGLPAYVLVKVFGPPFFARGDTVTPVKVALGAIAANTALAIALAFPLAHVGVALATAVAAWGNAGALLAILVRRGFYAPDARLKRRIPRIILASAAMAAVLYGLGLVAFGNRIVALAILIAAGGAAFALAALACGAARLDDLRHLVRRPGGTVS
jgi:putative peptidoglycan lipid II flippase